MRIEYDRRACTGWFQCVQEWDAFGMNMAAGKATLEGGEEAADGAIVREVPPHEEEHARAAAEACPEDAIALYDDDGEQLVP
jgi:ferredoxin